MGLKLAVARHHNKKVYATFIVWPRSTCCYLQQTAAGPTRCPKVEHTRAMGRTVCSVLAPQLNLAAAALGGGAG